MPAGKYIYRVLRDDEDPKKGLSARDPDAKNDKISSHVSGLKKSPYISFTASEKTVKAFYWLAVKRWKKIHKMTCEKKFTVVKVDKEKLLKENKKVELFDLSVESERDKYLAGLPRQYNYAKAYKEVLIKGFVPADCIEVVDVKALKDDESSSEGYDQSDYNPDDMEDLIAGAGEMKLK